MTSEARRGGGAGAPVRRVVASPGGAARVYPEGIKPREASPARDSRADGPLSPAAGPSRAGAGVGGPVRTPVVRVPAGPSLPGRDRAIYNVCKGPMATRVWRWMPTWPRRSTKFIMTGFSPRSGRSRPGPDPGLAEGGRVRGGKGFAPTGEALPRRPISPCLLNVALHGLEEPPGPLPGLRPPCRRPQRGSPVVVRYADDVVVLCHSQEQAGQVKRGSRSGWRPGGWPSTRTRRESSTSARFRLPGVQYPPLPQP